MHPSDQSPVNPLPPVVWVLFVGIVGVEAALSLGAAGYVGGPEAVGWRLGAVRGFGVNGRVLDYLLSTAWDWQLAMRFLTYSFVHGAFSSALFAAVLLLALGKMVGEWMGQLAVLVVFFFSAIVGAVVFGLVSQQQVLIGAFPAVYGLIGCYTFLMWQRLDELGQGPARAFVLIGLLLAIQIGFSMFSGSLTWVADLAGFVCGLALSLVVVPGGMARLRRLVQRR